MMTLEPPLHQEAPPLVAIRQAPRRVLVVDDDPDVLESLKDLLDELGREVTVEVATNPKDALEILSHGTVDVLVTDYRMPEMSGIEMLRLAHSIPSRGCILLSAYDLSQEAVDARRAGLIRRYVRKPGDPERLLAMVREFLYPDLMST